MRIRNVRGIATAGAILFLALAGGASAARQDIPYEVEVGFDGVIANRSSLFPVTVTLQNNVGDTTGTISIRQPDQAGNYEVQQLLPFVTPASSIKRFVVLARVERQRDLELRVDFKDYIRPIRKRLRPQRSDQPLVLCVGVPKPYLASTAIEKYRFVQVPPKILPEDPLALDGVHMVIASGSSFMKLGRRQLETLRQWGSTGGTVAFVDPLEDEAFRRSFSTFAGGAPINLSGRGVYTFGAGLVASSGTADRGRRAFWEDNETLTGRLFPLLVEQDAEHHIYHYTQGCFNRLWQTKKSYGAWGFVSLLVIILAYIVVIGPIDRWVVRRLGKPYLTWAFFVSAIAAFSAVAYLYSSVVNIGEMRMVCANVVDVSPSQASARGNALFWVYSTRNARYGIATEAENVYFSGRESMLGAGTIVAGVDILNGRESKISARIPVFSAKQFDASWFTPWTEKIEQGGGRGEMWVQLPEDLAVDAAFLATEEGMAEMRWSEGNRWTRSGKPIDWYTVAGRLDTHVGPYWHYHHWGAKENTLPSQQSLRDYLVTMSFPPLAPADIEKHKKPQINSLSMRDYRELSLSIRDRLHGDGRVLLLFLKPESSLLPLSVRGHFPKRAEVNLLRIQLPRSG